MADFSGLGDLGFLKQSAGNKSDDVNKVDLLAQMLEGSSDMYDEVGRARVLESQMNSLQAQETPSILDRLLSPEGLISLLGTAAAGAAGGPAAAAGFGLGRLGGVDAAVEADKAQKRKAMEELSEQHEKALDRLDKSRQRFTTLLQAQPELFLDPVTGEQTVSPKLLGYYATGEPLPLSANAKKALTSVSENFDKQYSLLDTRLKEAPDAGTRKTILKSMFNMLKAPIDESVLDALAAGDGNMSEIQADLVAKYFPTVAAEVFIKAAELGVPLNDLRVVKLLHGNYRDPDAPQAGEVEVSDLAIQAGQRIGMYQQDPANLDKLRKMREESTTPMEFSLKLSEEVLGGERNLYDAYRKTMGLMDPNDLTALTKELATVQEQSQLADAAAGYEKLPTRMAMTPEEKRAADLQVAQDNIKARKQAVKTDQARQALTLASKARAALVGAGMSAPEAGAKSMEIMVQAQRLATRPDGKVDYERMAQEVTKLTNEATGQQQ